MSLYDLSQNTWLVAVRVRNQSHGLKLAKYLKPLPFLNAGVLTSPNTLKLEM